MAYLLSDGYVVAGFPSGAGLSWAKADTTGAKKKINAIACTPDPEGTGVAEQAVSFSGDCEGEDNWAVICEKDSSGSADQAENYPAFYYAAEYGRNALMSAALSEGWYLPSIAELYAVYANRERLNTSLACLSVDALENAYWSSSLPEVAASTSYHKSAWYLKFDDASIYSGSKTFEKYVIPIKKIIE